MYLEDEWPTHLQGKTSLKEKTLNNNSSFKIIKCMCTKINLKKKEK